MENNLTKIENKIYHYVDGVKVDGVHKGISGNISNITGNVSGIRGNVSGIRGNVSDISGDIDDCKITEKDRQKGIDISELIK